MFGSSFILSEIFISEWTLSLREKYFLFLNDLGILFGEKANSSEVRTMFRLGLPTQVLNAISFYSGHCLRVILQDSSSDMSGQVYRFQNTFVKLVWDVPRSAQNYSVEYLLTNDLAPVREKIISQCVRCVQKLPRSTRMEVKILQSIVKIDVRSVTGTRV